MSKTKMTVAAFATTLIAIVGTAGVGAAVESAPATKVQLRDRWCC